MAHGIGDQLGLRRRAHALAGQLVGYPDLPARPLVKMRHLHLDAVLPQKLGNRMHNFW